jgi:hypothetical protein
MSEVQQAEEDFQDIFDSEPEAEVEIVEEAAEETEEPETPEEQEPETEEPVEESEDGTTTSEKESWTLSAVLDEREKRQKAVKEAEELREKLAKYEESKNADVSIFEDEQGFLAKQEQKTQEALRNTALNMSEAFAESVFGEEKVAAAKQWMQEEGIKSPYALDQFNSAKLPYHTIIKLYDDDQARRDPEAYKAQLREELLAELKEKKPSTPSLASKRSVGAKTDPEDFDDLLKD